MKIRKYVQNIVDHYESVIIGRIQVVVMPIIDLKIKLDSAEKKLSSVEKNYNEMVKAYSGANTQSRKYLDIIEDCDNLLSERKSESTNKARKIIKDVFEQ